MKFEDILEEIGSFGKFQKLLCFILIPITTGLVGLTYYTQIFILSAPRHVCKQYVGLHEEAKLDLSDVHHTNSINYGDKETEYTDNNYVSTESSGGNDLKLDYIQKEIDKLMMSSLSNDGAGPLEHSWSCMQMKDRFVLNQNQSADLELLFQQRMASSGNATEPCTNGWNYDSIDMFPTLTSEQDWVCDEAWKPYLIISLFWLGNTIGAWILGVLGDMYGRRPTIIISLLIYGLAGVSSVFVNNFYGFTILRFLVGSAHHTITHLPFVLVVEFCGVESRVIPLFTIMMTYTIASLLAPALAWIIWSWRILAFATSVPALLVLVFYRFLPESSSWLIAQGRNIDAHTQLVKVARLNGHIHPEELVEGLLSQLNEEGGQDKVDGQEDTEEQPHSILAVFQYPKLRTNVLLVLLVWMIGCMTYYGHCQNTANLGSSLFISYLLGAAVEVPSWSVSYLINKFGRRPVLVGCFIMSGAAGFVYAVIPEDFEWLVISVALLGRMTITAAYFITLQYGPEIFPTVVRGQGVAVSETLGGIAIFLSPSIVYLGEFERTLPLVIFGVLATLGGAATLLLPETAGKSLPQTMQQGEIFAKKSKGALHCCSSKNKEDISAAEEFHTNT